MENATRFKQQTTDALKIATQKPFKHDKDFLKKK